MWSFSQTVFIFIRLSLGIIFSPIIIYHNIKITVVCPSVHYRSCMGGNDLTP